jgi:hypothetical protein
MPKDIPYWPVFLFNGSLGDFKIIGIFTSEAEANAFAEKINEARAPEQPKAKAAEFTLEGIESHIIQYWMRASFPEEILRSGVKKLYDRNGQFPVCVADSQEAAA